MLVFVGKAVDFVPQSTGNSALDALNHACVSVSETVRRE